MSYSLFIAEDEHLIRNSLKKNIQRLTESLPLTLSGDAPDGELALSEILQKKPDILLSDIRMPFMDGLELAKEAKKHLPQLKIVFISGFDDFSYAKKAISLQAQEYLLKPIKYEDLEHVLAKIVEQLDDERHFQAKNGKEDHLSYEVKKNHFLNLLFKGELSLSAALEQGQNLQRELAGKTYQVMLITNQAKQDFEDYSSLRQELQQRFENAPDLLIASVSSRYLKVLVMTQPSQDIEARSREVANQLVQMNRAEGTHLVAALGTPVQRLSEVPLSYQTAEKVLEFAEVIKSQETLSYAEFCNLVTLQQPETQNIYQELNHLDLENLPTFINSLAAKIANQVKEENLYRLGILLTLNMYLQENFTSEQLEQFHFEQNPVKLTQQATSQADFDSYLSQVLQEALAPQINPEMAKHKALINQATQYINQNYQEVDLSLNEVAEKVGLSSSHFSTIFSHALGKTFVEYLTERRLKEAKRLLTTTDDKLAVIAAEVGYNDPNYFSYIFKRKEQISPKDYRKKRL